MIQRGRDVVIWMLTNVQHVTMKPLIQVTIGLDTCVYTDAYDINSRLEQWGYEPESVCHSKVHTLGMTTVMACMKCTSTRWKVFGPR